MSIFTVNLYVSRVVQPIRLIYKSEERAKSALNHPIGSDGLFTLNDDFGVEIRLETPPIARVLSDAAEEIKANVEMSLLQHAGQLEAQKRVSSDPALNGKGTIIPFGGRPLG